MSILYNKLALFILVSVILSFGSNSVQAPLSSLGGTLTTFQSDSTTISSNLPDTSQNKVRLIQKTYNHKQQVILGIGMMAFIGIILYTVQSLNP